MRRFLAEITYVDGTTEAFAYDTIDAEYTTLTIAFFNCVRVEDRARNVKGKRIVIVQNQIRRFASTTVDSPPAPGSGDGEDRGK